MGGEYKINHSITRKLFATAMLIFISMFAGLCAVELINMRSDDELSVVTANESDANRLAPQTESFLRTIYNDASAPEIVTSVDVALNGLTDTSASSIFAAFVTLYRHRLFRSANLEPVFFNVSEQFPDQTLLVMRRASPSKDGYTRFIFFRPEKLFEAYSAEAANIILESDSGERLAGSAEAAQAARKAGNFTVRRRIPTGACSLIVLRTEEEAYEKSTAFIFEAGLISLGLLFLTMLCVVLFSEGIRRRIVRLCEAASDLENGTRHIHVPVHGHDELSLLTASFNGMSRILDAYSPFTPAVLARLSYKGRLVNSGMQRKSSVFFANIHGFAERTKKYTAVELLKELDDYMEYMVYCVRATGGLVDKFIGDGIMAHWGAAATTGSDVEDAFSAICSALLMRAAVRSFNAHRLREKVPIATGCSIATGPVNTGMFGSGNESEWSIIGKTVRVAAHMEKHNRNFGTDILISFDTWRLCGSDFITEELPTAEIDGGQERLFAVINILPGERAIRLLAILSRLDGIDMPICKKALGREGPRTLTALRALLSPPQDK